ncbi:MAG: rhodanese-like domain-containing protein [Tepidisphaeraceae bacterium]
MLLANDQNGDRLSRSVYRFKRRGGVTSGRSPRQNVLAMLRTGPVKATIFRIGVLCAAMLALGVFRNATLPHGLWTDRRATNQTLETGLIPSVTRADARDAIVIDARSDDTATAPFASARRLSMGMVTVESLIDQAMEGVDKQERLVVFCSKGCALDRAVAAALKRRGFTNVYVLRDKS